MRHVPEDEARDVRDLLQKNNIEFFETFSGNWSISIPAIWVSRDDQYTEARKIIDLYQAERANKAKKELLDQEIKGVKLRVSDVFIQKPLRFILVSSQLLLFFISHYAFFFSSNRRTVLKSHKNVVNIVWESQEDF